MHKSRLAALGIDCKSEDFERDVAFWRDALGYETQYDPDGDRYVGLKSPDGEMQVFLQKVDHPSRVHLDIETDDVEAEVARLKKLGAKHVETFPRWVVLEAPSGHRFCVVNPQRPDFPGTAREWK